jgi:hypothetical protein
MKIIPGWIREKKEKQPMASTTAGPAPAPTAPQQVNVFTKIWNWIKKGVTVVEADLAAILGTETTAKLEVIGKALLDGELGALAAAAIADATDVATGQMSVSKAIASLISLAEAEGKKLSQAAALQVIALAQNALPTASGATVVPVA